MVVRGLLQGRYAPATRETTECKQDMPRDGVDGLEQEGKMSIERHRCFCVLALVKYVYEL